MVRPRVFFDLAVDTVPIGRVIFELYNDSVPKTSNNFRALCTGEKGLSSTSHKPLYYKNSTIHRSIRDFMIQGGDFTKHNGTGGESIFDEPFPDEDLSRPLDSEGLLVMANKGPNTNGSQFFITLRDCPHLNGKHVVFGRVIRGYDDVILKVAQVPTDEKDRPTARIVITNCGELELRKPPAKQPSESLKPVAASDTEEEENGRHTTKRRRHSRSPSRSRSRTPPSDDEPDHNKRRYKKRREKRLKRHERDERKRAKRRTSDAASDDDKVKGDVPKAPREETEEEYDARLEREENERLEAARKLQLEQVKKRYEAAAVTTEGIRFKGRGRMKFIDPEIRAAKENRE